MMIKQAAIDLIVALKGYTLPKQAEYAYNHLCKAITEEEAQEQMSDLVVFGESWSKNGKRIPLNEIYKDYGKDST